MNDSIKKPKTPFERLVLSGWRMGIYLFTKLPLAWVAGLRVDGFDATGSTVSVPFRFITRNPFRSVYFAPLSMAAELSSGLLALEAVQQSGKGVSMLVLGMQAEYTKKAKSRIRFRCNDRQAIHACVAKAVQTGEAQTFISFAEGKDTNGDTVARFNITWTFKQKT